MSQHDKLYGSPERRRALAAMSTSEGISYTLKLEDELEELKQNQHKHSDDNLPTHEDVRGILAEPAKHSEAAYPPDFIDALKYDQAIMDSKEKQARHSLTKEAILNEINAGIDDFNKEMQGRAVASIVTDVEIIPSKTSGICAFCGKPPIGECSQTGTGVHSSEANSDR